MGFLRLCLLGRCMPRWCRRSLRADVPAPATVGSPWCEDARDCVGRIGGIGAGFGASGPSEDEDNGLLRAGEHDAVDASAGKGRCPWGYWCWALPVDSWRGSLLP